MANSKKKKNRGVYILSKEEAERWYQIAKTFSHSLVFLIQFSLLNCIAIYVSSINEVSPDEGLQWNFLLVI